MTRVRIKICGITDARGVDAAVDAGADAVGFVFADSPRKLSPRAAYPLLARVPPLVFTVGVFRHPNPADFEALVQEIHLDLIQVEPDLDILDIAGRLRCRVLPVRHDAPDLEDSLEVAEAGVQPDGLFLLEAQGRGGRGVRPDWKRAATLAQTNRLVLAGGLTPRNVRDAIRRVRPWAVDVSSGVEVSPGIKDVNLIRAFVDAVRGAERDLYSQEAST